MRVQINHNISLMIVASMLLITIDAQRPARATDFNDALRNSLREACPNPSTFGKLREACDQTRGRDDPSGPVSGIFSATGASAESGGVSRATERRLESLRRTEEKKISGRAGSYTYAFDGTRDFAQRGDLQLPPVGGASPDIVFGVGPGASVFLSAGAYVLNHHNNRFEDGYEAQLPMVTVGADYLVNDWLLAGIALNYTNYDGTYDDGGGFNKHIFGPLLYATFMPFQGAFADVVLGYARQENSNNRRVGSESATPDPEENPPFPVEGHTSADYSEDQYIAGILAGYDQPFGNVTVGPRLGLAFSYEDFGNIKEEGNTGLELRYNNLNQTSVQSSLGVLASVNFPTAYGVMVPQAAVAWVHEYANNARNIDAQLIEAPATPSFTFSRERPARDWASIGLGVSAILPNGLRPFVQFATIQGNEHFVSYGGTLGLRAGL
jgi:uncharacterized protein YhjY with autotransporter beta-barrel domain